MAVFATQLLVKSSHRSPRRSRQQAFHLSKPCAEPPAEFNAAPATPIGPAYCMWFSLVYIYIHISTNIHKYLYKYTYNKYIFIYLYICITRYVSCRCWIYCVTVQWLKRVVQPTITSWDLIPDRHSQPTTTIKFHLSGGVRS